MLTAQRDKSQVTNKMEPALSSKLDVTEKDKSSMMTSLDVSNVENTLELVMMVIAVTQKSAGGMIKS